jgi:hypothetical protein
MLASALTASLRAVAKSVAAIALTAGLSASMRAIDASRSSTGEISFVPMRRRISTDVSSKSSLFDTMTYLPTVTRGSICFAMPFCEEDGLPGQARQ